LGCPLALREVWASKSFLSPPGDPGIFEWLAEGTINLGCPLALRENWANKSLLSLPVDPGLHSNYLNFMPMNTAKPQG
jgi:hypothetical protein